MSGPPRKVNGFKVLGIGCDLSSDGKAAEFISKIHSITPFSHHNLQLPLLDNLVVVEESTFVAISAFFAVKSFALSLKSVLTVVFNADSTKTSAKCSTTRRLDV